VQNGCLQLYLIATLWAATGLPVAAQSLILRPEYSAGSIVNAASGKPGRIAPNTIISIYGTNLALSSWAISPQELLSGYLPTSTPFGSVYVRLLGNRLPLFYVSPQQINALMPANLLPGMRNVEVYRELVSGPLVSVLVQAEAPELFRVEEGFVAATHADGRVVTEESPAEEGEVIVMYGTGFGPLKVVEEGVVVPRRASEVARAREYRIRINSEEQPQQAILYVGVTPGFAGLYQMNVKLPKPLTENPKVEIGVGANWSADDLRVRTRKSATL